MYSDSKRTPASSSGLASLFNSDLEYQRQSGNQSLQYKKEKKPSTGQAMQQPQSGSTAKQSDNVLYAGMVNLIKYDASRQGSLLGARALAVMKNSSGSIVAVIYKPDEQKQDVVQEVKDGWNLMVGISNHIAVQIICLIAFQLYLLLDFYYIMFFSLFQPQPPSYFFFHDSQQQHWCIQLPSTSEMENLAKVIIMAKSISAPNNIISQDVIVPTEGKGVANGDAVKVKMNL